METITLLENESKEIIEEILEQIIHNNDNVNDNSNIKSILMELIELDLTNNNIEHPKTLISLEYMLNSKLLFTDDYEKNKFFIDLEESFSIIVKNNNIDIKDIPEILELCKRVYILYNKNICNNDKINNYELTNVFLLTSMRVYLTMIKCKNNNILYLFDKIISSAIELLKEKEVIHKKSWVSILLCCKK